MATNSKIIKWNVFECCCSISSKSVDNLLILSLYKLELTSESNFKIKCSINAL